MEDVQEQKNKIAALFTSLGVHVALILLFVFVVGFTAPDPPLGEQGSGVELQLGVDDTGSGDVQQDIPITPSDALADATAEAEKLASSEEVKPSEEGKTVAEDQPKENVTTEDEESPVVVREVKKDIKKTETPKEKVIPDKPKETPVKEVPNEEKKEVKKTATETTTGSKTAGDVAKGSKGVSQGNDKGKTGDKGVPEGVPDLKAQYSGKAGKGGPGDGGAGGISVDGFDGFDRPDIAKPEIPEDSYGTYKFSVSVNSQGEIEKITTQTRGVSLEAEQIFKKLIQNLDFTPNKSNLPAFSEGTITFRVVPPRKK